MIETEKKTIFIEAGIIKRPISTHAWKMIACCKGRCKNIENANPLTAVQEYLKNEYLCNQEYLSYSHLYTFLIQTAIEVLNEKQIQNLLEHDIPQKITNMEINDMVHNRKSERSSMLSYEDLCQMLISKFQLMKVRETKHQKTIDLFVIFDEDDKMMTIDEAEAQWLNIGEQKKKS